VDTDKVKTGKTVVVAGAGLVGCETALHLVQQGRKVTLVDMIKEIEIAEEAGLAPRSTLLDLLRRGGVKFMAEVKLEEITDDGVIVVDKEWNRIEIPADTVVLSFGYVSRSETVDTFKELAPEVYVIGDCKNPKNLMAAIHDGFNVAVEI
jgi:2-enoate reductase